MIWIYNYKMFQNISKMKFKEVLCLFSLFIITIEAASHWMVTESGLIQPRVDSPFEMENPYDLLAFISQDTRWDNIISLYHDLSKRQNIAADLWATLQRKSDITTLILQEDTCNKAGQLSYIDWYAAFLEEGKSKKIPNHEYSLYKPMYGRDLEVPDCKKISSLTFSMFAFEHLEGVAHRENLTASPELALPELISPIMTIDQFGHWLSVCLKKNSSSWLHYNMASMYWRVRGNSPKAIECSRRALHYAPREYKDVALLSLGSVLHRSKKTEDAIIVLGAAVDHDPQYHINHFTLATAYAVLGDYNSSLKHLDICMKLQPTFELAVKYKYGVKCHAVLLKRLNVIRKVVDQLREQLIEYTGREAQWIKLQSAFLRTMKHSDKDDDFRNVIRNSERMSELTGLNIKDLKKEGDRYSVIQYFLDGPVSITEKLQDNGVFALDSAYSLQRLVKHIEKHANMASNYVQPDLSKLMDAEVLKEIESPVKKEPYVLNAKDTLEALAREVNEQSKLTPGKKPSQPENLYGQYFTGHFLFPPSIKINRNHEDFDRDHHWPTNKLCKEAAPSFPENLEAIYPVFLPLENKGIRLNKLLSDQIGVPLSEEHELPWYPPLCPQDKEALAFTQKKSKNHMNNAVVDTGYLRQKLLEYVGDGDLEAVMHMQDVEIGHRIYIAMQRKLAPDWLLYLLSSLYWRVRGNNANALHCLLSANKKINAKYRDLVYGSLASLYLEMGYFEESLSATEEGFKLGIYEPTLNFVLSELNMLRKHHTTHVFHLKQVIRVEPKFMGGLARNLLNGWSCILKQVSDISGEICTQVEPGVNMICEKDGSNCHITNADCIKYDEKGNDDEICTEVEPGVNMVCGKGGTNCHVTNAECVNYREKESSSLVRLLRVKDKESQETAEIVDDSMFNAFKENMPAERTNKLGHQQNFEMMLLSIDTALRGCGRLGCDDINAADLLLTKEDCSLEHLDLNYWLQNVGFRELITDCHSRLLSEFASIAPSKSKVPECNLPLNFMEDFFIERILKMDTEGWVGIQGLMQQFAEIFEFHDFAALGARITKFVEDNPNVWEGLVAAGWWCGTSGRAACALRCFAAAHYTAPPQHKASGLRALTILLYANSKKQNAGQMAFLSFYTAPAQKIDAFLVGVAHSYALEYEQAVWMYRFSLTFDSDFLPAKACLHSTMCVMLFGEVKDKTKDQKQ